jgi:3-phosphoshikimate 1-carboxyvinyltransferase
MIEIKPLDHFDTVITIPGSKSYTHRAFILSALANGKSVLINALHSEDTEYTVQGLIKFGVPIFWEGDVAHVFGKGGELKSTAEEIFVGNSGTSMRFLTALSALKNGRTLLDGSERMRRRPIKDLLNGLKELGVRAYSQEENGYPPVIVDSRGLEGGTAKIKGEESSQFLSALLMVAPYSQKNVCLEVTGHLVSKPYVDITLDIMSTFGVEVQNESNHSFLIRAGQSYLPQKYRIDGDASNASYFFSAAAISRGRLRVENFNPASLQGDKDFLNILKKMGCEVILREGGVEVRGQDLQGIEIDMNRTPDLVPTLAVTAAFAQGKTVIKNIGHLHLKESDRIQALTVELSKMGIQVEEGEDWLRIEGGKAHGAEIESYHDHRIAMSFAIAGLVVPGIKINGEQCVDKSFPGFWEKLKELY